MALHMSETQAAGARRLDRVANEIDELRQPWTIQRLCRMFKGVQREDAFWMEIVRIEPRLAAAVQLSHRKNLAFILRGSGKAERRKQITVEVSEQSVSFCELGTAFCACGVPFCNET